MNSTKDNIVIIISPRRRSALLLGKQLSCCGFNVTDVQNPRAFLEESADRYAVIAIIDLDLYDSFDDVLQFISKTLKVLPYVPFLVLSSKNDINIKLKLFELGISDYILKPVDILELSARIHNYLTRYRLFNTLEQKNRKLEEKTAVLEQLTITDAMTGLYNKRYILDRLDSEICHSARYNEPISFIMADIDFFKKINDKYGHICGDTLLKEIGRLIKTSIRSEDIAARYGGEEFLIVCPNTDSHGAKILAERIRKRTQNSKFTVKSHNIVLTLSIGIKSIKLTPGTNAKHMIPKLIEQADAALYRAKLNGRNRVEVYGENKA